MASCMQVMECMPGSRIFSTLRDYRRFPSPDTLQSSHLPSLDWKHPSSKLNVVLGIAETVVDVTEDCCWLENEA